MCQKTEKNLQKFCKNKKTYEKNVKNGVLGMWALAP